MFVITITFLMHAKAASHQFSDLVAFVVDSMMGGDINVTNIRPKLENPTNLNPPLDDRALTELLNNFKE